MPKTQNENEYLYINNYYNHYKKLFINMVNKTDAGNNTTSAKLYFYMNLNKRYRHYIF